MNLRKLFWIGAPLLAVFYFAGGCVPAPVPSPHPSASVILPSPSVAPHPTPSVSIAPSPSPSASFTASTPLTSSSATPSPKPSALTSAQAAALMLASPCGHYRFKVGKANSPTTPPAGYLKGMAEVFQRSYCLKRPVMAQPLGSPDKDALAAYGKPASLVDDYTLLLSLGMRESSGNYGEGVDTTAGAETASESEAGAFQFSFNSIGANPALSHLYAEYSAAPGNCLLSVFSEGARGSYQGINGTGNGAVFQKFTKSCPAFQAEYAATLIRVLRAHFGPLVRKEAEFRPECAAVFQTIQDGTVCP